MNVGFKTKVCKVLVALSGGVDSAVAAALLLKQGYNVIGGFIKCYSDKKTGENCWVEDRRDATRVCAKLGIKLLVFDFEKQYRRAVVDYLYREYRAGRTPNPDVMCNKSVKFPLLLREAKKLGFDYVATGHYARIKRPAISSQLPANKNKFSYGRKLKADYRLLKAADSNKDQTYFLHQLTQKELRRVLFPIGGFTKPEVRGLASRFGLPVARKEESMGICFIGEVPIRQFLLKKIKPRPGKILVSPPARGGVRGGGSGQVVGEHMGLPFYTIGQRIGLKFPISNFQFSIKSQTPNSKPFYVIAKDKKKNLLIVGHDDDPLLYKKEIRVGHVNWIAGHPPRLPFSCEVRLRHRQTPQHAVLRSAISGQQSAIRKKFPYGRKPKADCRLLLVNFDKPQRAVAPGQFAVFYHSGECLGGGEIV